MVRVLNKFDKLNRHQNFLEVIRNRMIRGNRTHTYNGKIIRKESAKSLNKYKFFILSLFFFLLTFINGSYQCINCYWFEIDVMKFWFHFNGKSYCVNFQCNKIYLKKCKPLFNKTVTNHLKQIIISNIVCLPQNIRHLLNAQFTKSHPSRNLRRSSIDIKWLNTLCILYMVQKIITLNFIFIHNLLAILVDLLTTWLDLSLWWIIFVAFLRYFDFKIR